MGFKLAMKLLSIFEIEVQGCKIFDHLNVKCKENKQILAKLKEAAKNCRFEARKLMGLDSEARPVKNQVTYKQNVCLRVVYECKTLVVKHCGFLLTSETSND